MCKNLYYSLLSLLLYTISFGQEVTLYEQFLGKYDFTMIGNTHNIVPNGSGGPCNILTTSSASLNLNPDQEIAAAYLYWAGSGSVAQFDYDIRLNGVNISPERTFTTDIAGRPVSGGFTDITAQVIATGNGTYTVTDFDLSAIIADYCGNGTNFGGWSILIVYFDPNLGYNMINIYDGFTRVDQLHTFVEFELGNLNVLHLAGNRVGFLAWEGDHNIANEELLRINTNIVSNPPLNPADNVFNGTNSFTNSNTLYNMDLDFFDISDYTSVGDDTMTISLESHQDAIILNNIVVVLNSEVPDATIDGSALFSECDLRDVEVDYTVYNTIATDILPAGTPIAFYAEDLLVGQSATVNDIPIGGFEEGQITLSIPMGVPANFTLILSVDDDGTGNGTVTEFKEDNNTFEIPVILGVTPTVNPYNGLEKCDTNNDGTEIFDLTLVGTQMLGLQTGVLIRYYTDQGDAEAGNGNNLANPASYTNTSNPQTIYVRMEDTVGCYITAAFEISIIPPAEFGYVVPDIEKCSPNLETTGIEVNLTQNQNAILNGNDPINYIITYHLDQNSAMNGDSPIADPTAYINTISPQTIWARMVDPDGCVTYGSFEIIIVPAQEMDYTIPELEFCSPDMNPEDIAVDLTLNQSEILNGNDPADYTITYYTDQTDAINGTNPILNPDAYENQTSPETIWVRMVSTEGCVTYGSFVLIFSLPSEMDYLLPNIENCSENQVLTGIPTNLTQIENEILNGNDPDNYTISYHLNQDAAANGINPITNPENYENTSSPQTIWARLIHNTSNCVLYGAFQIIYNPAPLAFDAEIQECSMFGPALFDLTLLNPLVVAESEGLQFSYYLTEEDALNQNNPLPLSYTPPEMIFNIFVRIQDDKGCFSIVEAELESIVNTEELNNTFLECDSPWEPNDGITEFNLTLLNGDIMSALGLMSADISFHLSAEDAVSGNNPIQTPEAFQNSISPQMIYARAVGTDGNCGGVVTFNVEVMPVPEFELPDYLAFCNYDVVKSYTFDVPYQSYIWRNPSGEVISTSPTVQFTMEGEHTLEVRENQDGCPAIRSVEVIIDEPPIILDIQVDGHTVKVFATGGHVPYKYSINNGLTWGTEYIMNEVPGGVYDMLVMSKYGCISDAKFFGVLGIPNFISPNGDGKNDYWYVRGLEAYPKARIQIFDRYGKMFVDRELGTNFIWDGRYKGDPISSGDYWYIIIFEDGKKLSGHITVRNY